MVAIIIIIMTANSFDADLPMDIVVVFLLWQLLLFVSMCVYVC